MKPHEHHRGEETRPLAKAPFQTPPLHFPFTALTRALAADLGADHPVSLQRHAPLGPAPGAGALPFTGR
jgi:hypothetical protein